MLNVHDQGSLPLPNALAGAWAEECRTFGEALAWQARVRGDSPALVDAESDGVTFGELHTCIASFAGHLARAGLKARRWWGLARTLGAQLVIALVTHTTLVP